MSVHKAEEGWVAVVGVPGDDGEGVLGLCLGFAGQSELDAFFGVVAESFEDAGGRLPLTLQLRSSGDGVSVHASVASRSRVAVFEAKGVENTVKEHLLTALRSQRYYFILGASKPIDQLSWRDVVDHYMYKANAEIDGQQYFCSQDGTWPAAHDPVQRAFSGA